LAHIFIPIISFSLSTWFFRYHEGSVFFELQRFVHAIVQGLPAEVGVEQGLLAVAVGLAAEKSIREKRIVRVDEILAPQ
jgi:myo-inositol 2-dehydrogenase/D-chiro-inositol 1-dehydrogenase